MNRLEQDIRQICVPDYVDTGIALVNDARTMHFDGVYQVYADMVILLFVRKGWLQICIDGEPIKARAHQMIIQRPGRRLSSMSHSDDFQGHAVMLTVRYGQSVLAVAGNIWKYIINLDSQPVVTFPRATSAVLQLYYPLLVAEVARPNNMYYRDVVSSLIRSMLCSMINDLRNLAVKANAPEPDTADCSQQAVALFNRFIDILTNEHCTQRKIEYYADRLCVTPKYLSTVCKRVGKHSAHQWITDAIVNGIHNYLRYSDKSVKEIAMIFGFPNLAFFSRYVKEHLGAAPTDLRKN